MYKIKEIYYTIQGEGFHTGRPAVFCRFSGCNLWTGLEKDRDKATCKFCDTDFWGMDGRFGGKYTKEALADIITSLWPKENNQPVFVVCTGGEPALQLDQELVDYFHKQNIEMAIETNGTIDLPKNIDWICVSPKANTGIVVTQGHELKLVYPQLENHPKQFEHFDFQNFFLQPLDDKNQSEHTTACVQYCLQNPKWKLSVQTHKFIGID
ncbi:MAG: 7-carboxy-7-deazaguanine synthase [Saprospiraceae bacterium]